jgi:hypothetical protein
MICSGSMERDITCHDPIMLVYFQKEIPNWQNDKMTLHEESTVLAMYTEPTSHFQEQTGFTVHFRPTALFTNPSDATQLCHSTVQSVDISLLGAFGTFHLTYFTIGGKQKCPVSDSCSANEDCFCTPVKGMTTNPPGGAGGFPYTGCPWGCNTSSCVFQNGRVWNTEGKRECVCVSWSFCKDHSVQYCGVPWACLVLCVCVCGLREKVLCASVWDCL